MQQVLLKRESAPPLTARNVAIWLINYYGIPRGNELSIYWGLPVYIDNYEAIKMWVERLTKSPRPIGRTLGDVRRRFETKLLI